jgi:hypothetical protein
MVNPPDPSQVRRDWQAALQAGPDCLAIERLVGELSPEEVQHLAGCASCQAERRLLQEFEDARAGADDKAVRDIAAGLRRRRAGKAAQAWVPAWFQVAAVLALTTAVGYGLWDREPALRAPSTDAPVYRSPSIETGGPDGDVSTAPVSFEWQPLDGAVRYAVTVREVDGTELWSASSAEPLVPIPPDVQLKMQPGKTLLWEVAAFTARGEVAARSTLRRFRVVGRLPSSGD